jgi:hypothetical protein
MKVSKPGVKFSGFKTRLAKYKPEDLLTTLSWQGI